MNEPRRLWLRPPAEPVRVSLPDPSAGLTPRRFTVRVILAARRYILPAAGLMVLYQLGEAMVPVIMGLAIDRAIGGADPAELVLWLVLLALNYVVFSLSFRFGSRIGLLGAEAVQHHLRTAVSERLLHPGGADGAARLPGVGLALATSDVSRLATAVAIGIHPVGQFAAIVFGGVVLLTLSWPLGLAVLVGAPAIVLLIDRAGRTLRQRSGREQALAADASGKAADLMAGYRIIAGLGAGTEASDRYRIASQQALGATLHAKSAQGALLGSMTAATGVFLVGITVAAGFAAYSGSLSVGALITVVGLTQFLIGPLTVVATNLGTVWAAALASAERVLDVLTAAMPHRQPAAEPSGHTHQDTSPTALTLTFPVRDTTVEARIAPGECVGIPVDDAGAALLVELLSGRTASDDSRAWYADRPAHEAAPGTILVSPHAADLFDGSIMDNVALDGVSEDRATLALGQACCEEFVRALPAGPDTSVGEGGRRLSGGQRQRVALARALAQDSPVLVLHDPTTAVDSVTEHTIAGNLRDCRAGSTTLLLTRSPALLAATDRVLEIPDTAAPAPSAASASDPVAAEGSRA